jgi:hypothetical protein
MLERRGKVLVVCNVNADEWIEKPVSVRLQRGITEALGAGDTFR